MSCRPIGAITGVVAIAGFACGVLLGCHGSGSPGGSLDRSENDRGLEPQSLWREAVVDLGQLQRVDPAVVAKLGRAKKALEQAQEQVRGPATVAERAGELGMQAFAYRLLEPSEMAFRIAVSAQPTDHRWLYLLGRVLGAEGRLMESIETLERALLRAPRDSPTAVALGDALLESGRAFEALEVGESLVAEHPEMAVGYSLVGRAQLALRDPEEAVEALQEALSLSPGASGLRYPLGLAYRALGDLNQARHQLESRGD